MSHSIQLLSDNSSVLHHNIPDLPIAIQKIALSDYAGLDIIPHWNNDITLIRIDQGDVNVSVEKSCFMMHTGDMILINARKKHHVYSVNGQNATFTTILFHPNLFLANLKINSLPSGYGLFGFPAFHLFHSGTEEIVLIQSLTEAVISLNENRSPMYQLRILGYLHLIIAHGLSCASAPDPFAPQPDSGKWKTLHRMLDYIHHHLQDKITIAQLSAAAGVCSSRCFELFREGLQCTPVEYINDQRLATSCSYLVDRKVSIASVATICGFSSQSYYTKLFVRKYGITPGQFREQNIRHLAD